MPNGLLRAGASGTLRLPAHLLPALLPLLVLVLALDVFCLINLARARSVRNAPKLVWVIIIVGVSAPIGALVYLFFGMERKQDRLAPDRSAGDRAEPDGELDPASKTAPSLAAAAGPRPADRQRDAGPQPMTPDSAAEDQSLDDHQPIVSTNGLTRDYHGTGLFDVDLLVPRGSIYGLVGLNGAGKTTLLCLLAAIRRADRGTVTLAVPRNRVAVCPDVPEFDGWLTAYEVVDLARSLIAPEADGQAVTAALRTAGLADSAGRRAGGFSRGMTQRLGLACALVGDPELLILDEPTAALDPAGRAEMLGLVAAMRGSRTVIFSSHILADVQRVADQVGILRDGRLLYQGATRDLIDTHLRPSWLVRIGDGADAVAAAMTPEPWVTSVEPAGAGAIRVDAASVEAGERGIPAVIAACGARQVSCEPVAADLESAFLALTGTRQQDRTR